MIIAPSILSVLYHRLILLGKLYFCKVFVFQWVLTRPTIAMIVQFIILLVCNSNNVLLIRLYYLTHVIHTAITNFC